MVKQTGRALYRHWQLAPEDAPVRGLLARAARLVTEITLGRGEAAHLAAFDEVALELSTQGLAGAWPLGSSLRHYREQWERHSRRESCPEGLCLSPRMAPCHSTCPANIDIPSFIAHLGRGDYRSTIEVIRRDNPLPLTCGLVLPGAVRVRLRARRQQRGRLHPAAEGQGGRALPRRGWLPETRDRARYRQAHRHRRVGPGRPHRGLLPAHLRSSRSRSSRRRRRPGACFATAFRPIACRPTCWNRRSTRSGCWESRSTPAPRSAASRRSARTTTRCSSGSAPSGRASSRSTVSSNPSSSAASTSCAPCAAANRCGLGRGSWSSAAATSRSTSP